MTNTFYIAYTESSRGTWYMLLIKDTHFCLSCGSDLDKILVVLKRYVKRCRTRNKLFAELEALEHQGKVSPATFNQRAEWYRDYGEIYEDLVHSVVLEAIREAKEEDKKNSPLYKTTSRLKRAGRISPLVKTEDSTTKEDSTPIPDSPKILRKPRVFNHK